MGRQARLVRYLDRAASWSERWPGGVFGRPGTANARAEGYCCSLMSDGQPQPEPAAGPGGADRRGRAGRGRCDALLVDRSQLQQVQFGCETRLDHPRGAASGCAIDTLPCRGFLASSRGGGHSTFRGRGVVCCGRASNQMIRVGHVRAACRSARARVRGRNDAWRACRGVSPDELLNLALVRERSDFVRGAVLGCRSQAGARAGLCLACG